MDVSKMELIQDQFKKMEDEFKKQREQGEKELLKEIHKSLFSELDFATFERSVLQKDESFRQKFEDSCLFVIESENLKTRYKCMRTVILIIAVETLMYDDYIDFNKWLITSKSIRGKEQRDSKFSDLNIDSFSSFKSIIEELYEIYVTEYGISNKIRNFFVSHLAIDSKKKLIKSISFKKKELNEYVHNCFISKEICFSHPNYGKCWDCFDECQLKNPTKVDEILKPIVTFIYGYFRSNFVHSGVQGHTADENTNSVLDIYRKKEVLIELSYEELKIIIIYGIKNYYSKNFKLEE